MFDDFPFISSYNISNRWLLYAVRMKLGNLLLKPDLLAWKRLTEAIELSDSTFFRFGDLTVGY